MDTVNIFFGKPTGEFHVTRGQSHSKHRRWILNRLTWGSGVVCGLDVEPAARDHLRIRPGVAIDPLGREIIIPEWTELIIDPRAITDACGCPTGKWLEGVGDVTICLAYHECEAKPTSVQMEDCEEKSPHAAGIIRGYKVLVREGKPAPVELACGLPDLFTPSEVKEGLPTIHSRLVDRISQACLSAREEDCVVLAHVGLSDTKVTQECIDPTVRSVVCNTSLLLELLLCLAERVEQCCWTYIPRYVSGDGQSGKPGEKLPHFLEVQLVDKEGNPVAGKRVSFEVMSGGGQLSRKIFVTNNEGIARTSWTLGAAGEQRVEASAVGTPLKVTFRATFST